MSKAEYMELLDICLDSELPLPSNSSAACLCFCNINNTTRSLVPHRSMGFERVRTYVRTS